MKKEIIAVTLATAVLGLSGVSYADQEKMRSKSGNMTTAQQFCMELNEKRAAAGKQALNCDDSKKTAGKDRMNQSGSSPMKK